MPDGDQIADSSACPQHDRLPTVSAKCGNDSPGGRVDHGMTVDHDGRDSLVAGGDGTHESGRVGVAPDIDHSRMQTVPTEHEPQPKAEHTTRSPIHRHCLVIGSGVVTLHAPTVPREAGWRRDLPEHQGIGPRPRSTVVTDIPLAACLQRQPAL